MNKAEICVSAPESVGALEAGFLNKLLTISANKQKKQKTKRKAVSDISISDSQNLLMSIQILDDYCGFACLQFKIPGPTDPHRLDYHLKNK